MRDGTDSMVGAIPDVSIIIPTYNRHNCLTYCLSSIAAMETGGSRVEVIVVDDGSSPPCEQVVKASMLQLDIAYYYQDNQGPAAARNYGGVHAKAPLLAFLDDDCALPSDWLGNVLTHSTANGIVGGKTINSLPGNIYASASQLLVDFLYAYYNENHRQARFFTSNNMLIPKALFQSLGGFSTDFPNAAAEDRDLCDRCLIAGIRLIYIPEIKICHCHALTLGSFLRQHFNYGHGALKFHQLRASRMKTGFRMEPPEFYRALICWPFTCKFLENRLRLTLLLLLSQLANAAGYFFREKNSLWQTYVKKLVF